MLRSLKIIFMLLIQLIILSPFMVLAQEVPSKFNEIDLKIIRIKDDGTEKLIDFGTHKMQLTDSPKMNFGDGDSPENINDSQQPSKAWPIRPVLKMGLNINILTFGIYQSADPGYSSKYGHLFGFPGTNVSVAIRLLDKVDIGCQRSRLALGYNDVDQRGEKNLFAYDDICFVAIGSDVYINDEGSDEQVFLKIGYGQLESTLNLLGYDFFVISGVKEVTSNYKGFRFGTFLEQGLKYRALEEAQFERIGSGRTRGDQLSMYFQFGLHFF